MQFASYKYFDKARKPTSNAQPLTSNLPGGQANKLPIHNVGQLCTKRRESGITHAPQLSTHDQCVGPRVP